MLDLLIFGNNTFGLIILICVVYLIFKWYRPYMVAEKGSVPITDPESISGIASYIVLFLVNTPSFTI